MNVAAGLDLPGAVSLPGFDQPVDAVVERGEVPHTLSDATRSGQTWQVAKTRLLLNVPGVARFLISEGNRVAFEPVPGRADEELSIFVMGSAMGALLHQRGSFVLHASAVVVNGKATLFCGRSGAGKSSLVAALSRAGHAFLTDDVSVVQFEDGQPSVIPDGRRLKLWSDTIDRLTLHEFRRSAVRSNIDKYWVSPPFSASHNRYPVNCAYFLQDAVQPERPGIYPLDARSALKALRANAYRPRLVSALNQEAEWFRACGAMARKINAYWFKRQLASDSLHESMAKLEAHWRGQLT